MDLSWPSSVRFVRPNLPPLVINQQPGDTSRPIVVGPPVVVLRHAHVVRGPKCALSTTGYYAVQVQGVEGTRRLPAGAPILLLPDIVLRRRVAPHKHLSRACFPRLFWLMAMTAVLARISRETCEVREPGWAEPMMRGDLLMMALQG